MLKAIANLSFYFTFANVIAMFFGGSPVMITLPIFGGCIFLSAVLQNKGQLRFVLLAFLPVCFIMLPVNAANILLLTPAIAYTSYNVVNANVFERWSMRDAVKLYAKLASFVAVVMLIIGHNLYEVFLPFAFVFFASSILFLRMSRHRTESSIVIDNRFKVLNIISVLGALLMGVALGSRHVASLIISAISFAYFQILVPAFLFVVGTILFSIGPFLQRIIDWIIANASWREEIEEALFDESGSLMDLEPGIREFQFAGAPSALLVIILGIICVCVFIFVLKWLRNKKAHHKQLGVRVALLDDRRKPSNKNKNRENRHVRRLREYYRRFIILCEQNKIPKIPSTTTADLAHLSADKFNMPIEAAELRKLYISVRYGKKTADGKDAKRAKELYQQFRKAGKGL